MHDLFNQYPSKNYQIFICGQLWSVNFDIQLLKRIFAPIFK